MRADMREYAARTHARTHNKVVLDNERRLLRMQNEALDDLR